MVDYLSVVIFLERINISTLIPNQLVDHRLEHVVVLAREQVFAAVIACAEVAAPFEERLHDVVESKERVCKILVFYAAQLHEATVAQQAAELVHAHGGVEFGMRHLEAESLFDVVHRRKV